MHWTDRTSVRSRLSRRSAVRELLKLTASPDILSFAGGLPAPELFPVDDVREATMRLMAHGGARALQYGETEGIPELRDWVAAQHSTPLHRVTRDQVLITQGSQQALDLVGRCLLDPGDRVAVENPTYLALLSAWRPLEVDWEPIPMDEDGLLPDALAGWRHRAPKVLYTIPNFQNPSGVTLSGERRRAVVRTCREHGVAVVEDDPYGALRFAGEPERSLFDWDTELAGDEGGGVGGEGAGNVIRVGSFSKVLAPGLRLGWVVAPGPLMERLVTVRQAMDLHPGTFTQGVVWELIRGGTLDRQLPRLRRAYADRCEAMLAALEATMPAGVRWSRPKGGMFVWLTLPGGREAGKMLTRALEEGVAFVPGKEFHADGGGSNTLRLNYSYLSCEKITEGVRRLAKVIQEG